MEFDKSKRCVHCGSSADDFAAFCPHCGASFGSSACDRVCSCCGARVPQFARHCPSCGNFVATCCVVGSNRAMATSLGDWLVLSVVTALVFFPIGIGALVFSLVARDAANRGKFRTASNCAVVARVWNIVLWSVSLITLLVAFVWCLVALLITVGLSGM